VWVQRVVDTLCASGLATRRAISGAPGNTLAAIGHFGWRIGQDGALMADEAEGRALARSA
jgi:hypothetical protein